MASFIKKELEELDAALPNYSRSLCKNALDLAKQHLGDLTKEQFMSHSMAFSDLVKIEASISQETRDWTMSVPIQPVSQLLKKPAEVEEFMGFLEETIPDDHHVRKLNADETSENSVKGFFAVAVISLTQMMAALEKKLRIEKVSEAEYMQSMDDLSEELRAYYELLLYCDSEIENINNWKSKRAAANKSNAGHTELHKQFFDYYAENGEKWSRAECARRFYRSLEEDHKRRYTSERHAERQLTEALRKHAVN